MDLREAGYAGCQNKMGRGQVERFDWLTLTPWQRSLSKREDTMVV